jgi:aspartate/methionine/tyrosine aminotransferase
MVPPAIAETRDEIPGLDSGAAEIVARPGIEALRRSEIRAVANSALGRKDVLAFWFGESDQPTPLFIREAAAKAVMAGETRYTHNLGRADLREALSSYLSVQHGEPVGFDRLAVTSAGVSALMIGTQLVAGPGDKVVIIGPIWPNLPEIPRILSAEVEVVPLEASQGGWRLDLDRLFDALTPNTRALVINSPNNPTGWILPADARAPILERCRRNGTWLFADDVYERLSFSSALAPSFLELAAPDDRVISTNSFSKAWRMTGWRLGWMVAPPALIETASTVIEYNTSCTPDFIQTAAIAALEGGEPAIAELRQDLIAARDQVIAGLRALPGVEVHEPEGAMYAFFRIEGREDSFATAVDMVDSAGLGLAPGSAFGDAGRGWLRWCFAARAEKNAAGLERLARYLNA